MKWSWRVSFVFTAALLVGACTGGTDVGEVDNNESVATAPAGTAGEQTEFQAADAPPVSRNVEPETRSNLPDASSPLTLIGALGALSLAAAAGLRAARFFR